MLSSGCILLLLQNSFFASSTIECSNWYMDVLIQYKTLFGAATPKIYNKTIFGGATEITVKHEKQKCYGAVTAFQSCKGL